MISSITAGVIFDGLPRILVCFIDTSSASLTRVGGRLARLSILARLAAICSSVITLAMLTLLFPVFLVYCKMGLFRQIGFAAPKWVLHPKME
jgi:hypothetical protein